MHDQKLYRSETDRMIAGVCGGLAKFFNVDATLVRLVFLLLLFLGGSGFLLYFILWIIVPQESQPGGSTQDVVQANAQDMAQTARVAGYAYHKMTAQIVEWARERRVGHDA
jgi:phage shock protein C